MEKRNKTINIAVCSELHRVVWLNVCQSTADNRYPLEPSIYYVSIFIDFFDLHCPLLGIEMRFKRYQNANGQQWSKNATRHDG